MLVPAELFRAAVHQPLMQERYFFIFYYFLTAESAIQETTQLRFGIMIFGT
jgi:hypothetical protein